MYTIGMKTSHKKLALMWKQIAALDLAYFKQAKKPTGCVVSYDHDYVGDHHPMHQLEIIRPEHHEGLLPVIVMIHGGGWVYGHKDSYYRYYAMELAHYGYAVVSCNYRLGFEDPFPAQVDDLFSVLHWLEAHAESEQLLLEDLYLVGDSAGAHLSALVAQIQTSPMLQTAFSVKPIHHSIKALGLSCGVYDLSRLVNSSVDLPMKDTLMEVLFDDEAYESLPLFSLASVSKNLNSNFPPCFIISSKADPLYPESKVFMEELSSIKHPYKSHVFPKKNQLPHVFNLKSIYPESAVVNAEMIAFFASFKS